MTLEADILQVLQGLAGGRVYPDVPPDVPQYPLITYQQIGGRALRFLDKTKPSHKHARVQFNVWATSRPEANRLARLIEDLLCESVLEAEPIGAYTALYEEAIKKYGTRQDLGIWYPDP